MSKHLTERERYKLEYMRKIKVPVKQIAAELGKTEKTIYNELKRGTVKLLNSELIEYEVYCADVGQRVYEEHQKEKGPALKIGNDLNFCRRIEELIQNKYSPYAALKIAKREGYKTEISLSTLYKYIKQGLFLNITEKDLPMKARRKKNGEAEKRKVALNNQKGTSIEERPKEIRERKEYGHWEMDTVVSGSGKGKSCLLVLSERVLREEIIRKIPNKKASSVVNELNRIEKEIGIANFRKKFKTITCDNGVEFLNQEGIERGRRNKQKKRTKVFYCHPFSSWERGTNENINKMIRRFIPKGESIDKYSKEEIQYIENWINNYPRKILGGYSAIEYKKRVGL